MRSFFAKFLNFLRRPSFLAFVYFAFLTCVMTYPLIFHMGELIGGGGDGLYYVWLIRWYQKALFELHISPFFEPFLNYPQGWYLASIDITPAMVIQALPVSLILGPVWGYNFSMLLSFVLAGWGMYLWVRHLTEDNLAGLVAGTIFAFVPYHMAHFLVGHLNLSGTQWFPFYFWGLYDLLRQQRFRWKPVLMATFAVVLIALTSPYYAYMTVVFSAVFFAGFIIFRGYRRLKEAVFWKSLLAFGLLSGCLLGLSLLPYFDPNARKSMTSFSLQYVSTFSASPTDFFIPSVKQFLWGEWIDAHFSPELWHESSLYIGAVAFILVIIACWKRRKLAHPELLSISILVALSAFVLALGIEPYWLGKKMVSLPRLLQLIFHRTDMPQIYLPAYYLFRYLPFFSSMRVMMRFGLFTLIFTSLMAGLGAHLLLVNRRSTTRKWLAVCLLVLIFIDFYPGPIADIKPIKVDPAAAWLATQPDTGAVAVFPFGEISGQQQVYNTLIYNKPYIGGHFNASHPEQYERILPVMNNFPSAESVEMLEQLGVAYVVVDSSRYSNYPSVDEKIRSFGLELLQVCGTEYVYGFQ